jgi:hypothetical protein
MSVSIQMKDKWLPFNTQHFFDSLHIIGPDEAVRRALRKRRFKVANVYLRTMNEGHDPEWVIEGGRKRRQLFQRKGHYRDRYFTICIEAHGGRVLSVDREIFLIIPMHRG